MFASKISRTISKTNGKAFSAGTAALSNHDTVVEGKGFWKLSATGKALARAKEKTVAKPMPRDSLVMKTIRPMGLIM